MQSQQQVAPSSAFPQNSARTPPPPPPAGGGGSRVRPAAAGHLFSNVTQNLGCWTFNKQEDARVGNEIQFSNPPSGGGTPTHRNNGGWTVFQRVGNRVFTWPPFYLLSVYPYVLCFLGLVWRFSEFSPLELIHFDSFLKDSSRIIFEEFFLSCRWRFHFNSCLKS